MRSPLSVVSHSPEDTRILGAALAPLLVPGDVIALDGDLGAGKTCLVQGMATALGIVQRVTSPTFTLVHTYEGRWPVVHLDVYRLQSFQEVLDLGFEEFLDPSAILVIEWGEAVAPLLPRRCLTIDLRRSDDAGDEDRVVTFRPRGEGWEHKLALMRRSAETLLDAASPEESTGERFLSGPHPATRDHRGDEQSDEEA